MKNFHIKSIVLGIGIGIIITSILSIIYSAGINPLNNLSEKDVEELCSKYDLVRAEKVSDIAKNDVEAGEVIEKDNTETHNSVNDADRNNAEAKDDKISENKDVKGSEKLEQKDNEDAKDLKNSPNNIDVESKDEESDPTISKDGVVEGKAEKNNDKASKDKDSNPAKLEPGTEVIITIKPGDSPKAIGKMLFQKGIIEDVALFDLRIRELGLTRAIIADKYRIKVGTSIDDILKMISFKNKQ